MKGHKQTCGSMGLDVKKHKRTCDKLGLAVKDHKRLEDATFAFSRAGPSPLPPGANLEHLMDSWTSSTVSGLDSRIDS